MSTVEAEVLSEVPMPSKCSSRNVALDKPESADVKHSAGKREKPGRRVKGINRAKWLYQANRVQLYIS